LKSKEKAYDILEISHFIDQGSRFYTSKINKNIRSQSIYSSQASLSKPLKGGYQEMIERHETQILEQNQVNLIFNQDHSTHLEESIVKDPVFQKQSSILMNKIFNSDFAFADLVAHDDGYKLYKKYFKMIRQ
jgi:hypothetical protein